MSAGEFFLLCECMGFKKREYNFYKKLFRQTIGHVPNHEIYGCEPIAPPLLLLKMLPSYIEEQNFEACKAAEDAIREWFTERGFDIPPGATLNIPSNDNTEFNGHLSLGDPNDPSGLASGGAVNF